MKAVKSNYVWDRDRAEQSMTLTQLPSPVSAHINWTHIHLILTLSPHTHCQGQDRNGLVFVGDEAFTAQ